MSYQAFVVVAIVILIAKYGLNYLLFSVKRVWCEAIHLFCRLPLSYQAGLFLPDCGDEGGEVDGGIRKCTVPGDGERPNLWTPERGVPVFGANHDKSDKPLSASGSDRPRDAGGSVGGRYDGVPGNVVEVRGRNRHGQAIRFWCAEARVRFGFISRRTDASRAAVSEWLRNELKSQCTRACDINRIVPIVVESVFVPTETDIMAEGVRHSGRARSRLMNYERLAGETAW
jgi:hypothetical protein